MLIAEDLENTREWKEAPTLEANSESILIHFLPVPSTQLFLFSVFA